MLPLRVPLVLLLLALAAAPTLRVQAQPPPVSIDRARSVLSYTGHHRLHDWTGTSRAVSGTLQINLQDPARSRIEVVVPVASFDSGNSNRDSNMLDTVEEERYADVRFVSSAVTVDRWERTADGYAGTWRVRGSLTFHGQTHEVEIPVTVRVAGRAFEAATRFSISLERFRVDRPRLMLMPISDTLDLEGTIRATL
jgi:polyisoprenoid-binding protein YceI